METKTKNNCYVKIAKAASQKERNERLQREIQENKEKELLSKQLTDEEKRVHDAIKQFCSLKGFTKRGYNLYYKGEVVADFHPQIYNACKPPVTINWSIWKDEKVVYNGVGLDNFAREFGKQVLSRIGCCD